ncbi:hypothetical protein [Rhizobium sp. BK418]|uniref:hypothetical protein n=1 Tax=Rhizobium sp. BK418 TaxID=2512120 RepID=UPI00104E9EB7|nr:hypothetical protein [Rhizobium sp. BK418]TCS04587.1 hypothetical protein EV281_103262 [Rhizobium sp. BK418]
MGEGGEVDSTSEGFRQPPDQLTEPCLTYMARIMELREFVAFYYGFVKTSAELRRRIPVTDEDEGDKALKLLRYEPSRHGAFMNQIMLSRAIESFDLYLTTILRDVFIARPEMLKSEGTVDVATIIEVGNYQDLVWHIVEKKVHELSYKPLSELRRFILSRTGIDIFPSEEVFATTMVASEVRNLIAHNDCIANDVFMSRTKGVDVPLEISSMGRVVIDDAWLRRASYTLDSLVFRFDEMASQKFKLQTFNRMTAFLARV